MLARCLFGAAARLESKHIPSLVALRRLASFVWWFLHFLGFEPGFSFYKPVGPITMNNQHEPQHFI